MPCSYFGREPSPEATPVWERYAPWYITEETAIFAPDQSELSFYRKLRDEYKGPCLEIGAGHGRLAASLAAESITVALEPSRAMLAGWNMVDAALASRVRGVGQSLPFRDSMFGIITFPYNGIQCILDREDRRELLRESCRTLEQDGCFVVETCHAFGFRPEESGMERYRFRLSSGRTVQLVESVRRCVERRIITYDMTYIDSDGASENIVLELALLEEDELAEDLRCAGFRSLRVFGDYDGSSFSGIDSPRLLVIAGKGETQ
jgi:SAM-dependent methyltransferase